MDVVYQQFFFRYLYRDQMQVVPSPSKAADLSCDGFTWWVVLKGWISKPLQTQSEVEIRRRF